MQMLILCEVPYLSCMCPIARNVVSTNVIFRSLEILGSYVCQCIVMRFS